MGGGGLKFGVTEGRRRGAELGRGLKFGVTAGR